MFGSDGKMVTGWQQVDGGYYYFHTDGKMLTGWLSDGTNSYYMDPANGRMSTGWKQIENSYYYFNNSGHKLTGWIQIDGTYYYLNPSDKGRMAANTTLKIDGVSYTFAANGACTTSNGNALNVSNNNNTNSSTVPGNDTSPGTTPGVPVPATALRLEASTQTVITTVTMNMYPPARLPEKAIQASMEARLPVATARVIPAAVPITSMDC